MVLGVRLAQPPLCCLWRMLGSSSHLGLWTPWAAVLSSAAVPLWADQPGPSGAGPGLGTAEMAAISLRLSPQAGATDSLTQWGGESRAMTVTLEEKLEGEGKWTWAWEKWPRASEEKNWAECKSSLRKRGLTLS